MIDGLIAESSSGAPLMKSAILSAAKPSQADVQKLVDAVNARQDHTAYHLLFALRRSFPDVYRNLPESVRAKVLCDALTHLQFFNDWGHLAPDQSHDGEAALAVLELGETALSCLVPLLNDSKPAPLYGSEPAAMSHLHQYRIKDFAYRYVSLILGRQPAFNGDPQVRDADVERLQTELQSNG